ncbi:MAG: hypothetical protein GC185_08645 [Alphaproteobacteria bacterium]|nr:hypothetical protein [Alphaproteobacteria bacterium]
MAKTPKKDFSRKAAKKAEPEFQIFSDLDGVLTDFDGHATANGKYNEKGQPKWEELDLKWWKTMPAYDGAKEFYQQLRARGRTRMLTAPILNADCFRGKAEWVTKFRGTRFGLLDLMIARAEDKNLLARPNCILVDDRQKNIDQWVAASGIGILHTGDYADTLKRVDQAMEDFRNGKKAAPVQAEKPVLKIFIGPNGVLADFDVHGKATGKIAPDGKTDWAKLDKSWWKTLPAFEGAKKFYDAVRKLGPTRFLTGAVPLAADFEGPANWAMDFRPESGKFALLDVVVVRSKDKEMLAREGSILIDDRQENVDKWTAAGGTGILHSGDFADTLSRVQTAVADLAAKGIVPEVKPAKKFTPKPKP